ncbi:MORN repeat-containing protein 4-like [Hydractinia symbiolongicarpus]|uniref:MORN repeat-containing protein 4-like n=1 Tax=Hydractinia symbiolongicarpus TaxID=13093 RepID=UPI00254EB02C|nr:MORN repeat-containing protein 4-like [Hydractinia symbiolongicarpus]
MSSSRQIYTYPEGDVYEGDWSHEGKKHGIGQLKLLDGSVYEGRFQHGLFNGVGTFKFADGSFYQGEFSNGLYNGHGIYVRCDGMMFEGAFRNGRPDGPGLITFADGSHGNPKQEGYFEGTRITKRESAGPALKKARLCAERAKKTTLYDNAL